MFSGCPFGHGRAPRRTYDGRMDVVPGAVGGAAGGYPMPVPSLGSSWPAEQGARGKAGPPQ